MLNGIDSAAPSVLCLPSVSIGNNQLRCKQSYCRHWLCVSVLSQVLFSKRYKGLTYRLFGFQVGNGLELLLLRWLAYQSPPVPHVDGAVFGATDHEVALRVELRPHLQVLAAVGLEFDFLDAVGARVQSNARVVGMAKELDIVDEGDSGDLASTSKSASSVFAVDARLICQFKIVEIVQNAHPVDEAHC